MRPRLFLAGPAFGAGGTPVLSDLDGKAHGAYDLEGQSTLILVRPNGHVADRGAIDRPERLTEYCRRTFTT